MARAVDRRALGSLGRASWPRQTQHRELRAVCRFQPARPTNVCAVWAAGAAIIAHTFEKADDSKWRNPVISGVRLGMDVSGALPLPLAGRVDAWPAATGGRGPQVRPRVRPHRRRTGHLVAAWRWEQGSGGGRHGARNGEVAAGMAVGTGHGGGNGAVVAAGMLVGTAR